MADFVGLLKKTIDAQSDVNVAMRQKIYDRAKFAVERKLTESSVSPHVIKQQLEILQRAINEVEAFYIKRDLEAFDEDIKRINSEETSLIYDQSHHSNDEPSSTDRIVNDSHATSNCDENNISPQDLNSLNNQTIKQTSEYLDQQSIDTTDGEQNLSYEDEKRFDPPQDLDILKDKSEYLDQKFINMTSGEQNLSYEDEKRFDPPQDLDILKDKNAAQPSDNFDQQADDNAKILPSETKNLVHDKYEENGLNFHSENNKNNVVESTQGPQLSTQINNRDSGDSFEDIEKKFESNFSSSQEEIYSTDRDDISLDDYLKIAGQRLYNAPPQEISPAFVTTQLSSSQKSNHFDPSHTIYQSLRYDDTDKSEDLTEFDARLTIEGVRPIFKNEKAFSSNFSRDKRALNEHFEKNDISNASQQINTNDDFIFSNNYMPLVNDDAYETEKAPKTSTSFNKSFDDIHKESNDYETDLKNELRLDFEKNLTDVKAPTEDNQDSQYELTSEKKENSAKFQQNLNNTEAFIEIKKNVNDSLTYFEDESKDSTNFEQKLHAIIETQPVNNEPSSVEVNLQTHHATDDNSDIAIKNYPNSQDREKNEPSDLFETQHKHELDDFLPFHDEQITSSPDLDSQNSPNNFLKTTNLESENIKEAEVVNLDTSLNNYDLVSDIFSRPDQKNQTSSRNYVGLIVLAIIVVVLLALGWWVFYMNHNSSKPTTDTTSLNQTNSTTTNIVATTENADNANVNMQASSTDLNMKNTQRLMPNGNEANGGSLSENFNEQSEGTSIAPANAPLNDDGSVSFYERATAIMPASSNHGSIKWQILQRQDDPNGKTLLALRGDILIPGKDLTLHLTLRPNTEASVNADFFIDLQFIVPENFDGVNVADIGKIIFKSAENVQGEELKNSVPVKISNNSFIVGSVSQGNRDILKANLDLLRNLNYIAIPIVYGNGQIAEFAINKGTIGNNLFNQVVDNWMSTKFIVNH